ncbi:MAG: hypothetical protein A2X30_10885 [Elusimicrobia bacterium GWB2_63_16]|nr:MAG: hypothetical protein A2X30_10885 [Elusimicrobia bacterium GWB2_63_16]
MNTLIIGGSKFVGLRLAHKLAAQGHDVTALNRGVSGGRLPAGVRALKADRRDAAGLLAALAAGARGGFDAVFDICGYLPADVESFAAALGAAGLRIKHYVFCSSVAVYDFEAIKFCPVREDFPLLSEFGKSRDPFADYGRNKILCERALLANGTFPATIIRPAYIYGPLNYIYREAYFFDRAEAGRQILIPGGGHNMLHFIHVDDLADAFIKAALNPAAFGKAYNIAGPETVTAAGFAWLCAAAAGKKADIRAYDPGLLQRVFQPEELNNMRDPVFPFATDESVYYDTSAAARDLAWQPAYGLQRGIRDAYDWRLRDRAGKPQPAPASAPGFARDERILARLRRA